jgi:hypothetical protein
MAQREHETTGHDFACDNVAGPIRICPGSSIEEVSSDFVRAEDDYWLTSCVQVDQITWSDAL